MTEKAIKECEFYIADDKYSCELSFINKAELCNCDSINDCYYKQLKRLEQENKSLYEEKNCLHKIIDRLLENSGYSKDIASAEDFEDVYEDMQIKRNELIELEQENKELKIYIESNKQQVEEAEMLVMDNDRLQQEAENLKDVIYYDVERYRSALEEINILVKNYCNACDKFKAKTYKDIMDL